MHLEDNLFDLHKDLCDQNYQHSGYKFFQVFDNKKRNIHKAEMKDRIIHQIVSDCLNSIYENKFITDSYSSRKNKGQHKAVKTFCYFLKLARDDCREVFVLKCDIKKYFDNINQNILINFIKSQIGCPKIFLIIEQIIKSYNSGKKGKGVPLGNVTSQIFANIYLDIFDKYVKNNLKCRFFVRFNDDFVIILNSRQKLEEIRKKVISFALNELLLEIPLEKTSIRKIGWGIDFLGFTILKDAILLRNKTKDKIYNNIKRENTFSYIGILKHCNSFNLKQKILAMDKLADF